jgi:hypothetical protein
MLEIKQLDKKQRDVTSPAFFPVVQISQIFRNKEFTKLIKQYYNIRKVIIWIKLS